MLYYIGTMNVVIPRNSKVPAKVTQTFTTLYDNQESVTIKVYEGERIRTKDNNLLGTFMLTNIKKELRGIPQIDVTFSVDENGILSVKATDKITNKIGSLIIKKDKGRLTKNQIQNMILNANKNKNTDLNDKLCINAINAMEKFLYAFKKCINTKKELDLNKNNKKYKHNDTQLKIELNKINDKTFNKLNIIYNEYNKWFIKNSKNIKKSKIIQDKQKELQNKIGNDITNIIKTSLTSLKKIN